jgi:hypothetical protein
MSYYHIENLFIFYQNKDLKSALVVVIIIGKDDNVKLVDNQVETELLCGCCDKLMYSICLTIWSLNKNTNYTQE